MKKILIFFSYFLSATFLFANTNILPKNLFNLISKQEEQPKNEEVVEPTSTPIPIVEIVNKTGFLLKNKQEYILDCGNGEHHVLVGVDDEVEKKIKDFELEWSDIRIEAKLGYGALIVLKVDKIANWVYNPYQRVWVRYLVGEPKPIFSSPPICVGGS